MSLWVERDELVLRHLVEHPPAAGMLWTESRSDQPRPGFQTLTEADFYRSVKMLGDAGYLSWTNSGGEGGGGWHFQDIQVTGAGKQVLGLWPGFTALGSPAELAALLDALAEDAATEEERTNLQRAAAAVRRTAPDVIRGFLSTALRSIARSQLGLPG